MEQLLTADQVFGVGIEIEKNGRAFYAAAAAGAAGSSIRKLLNELAVWEKKHIEIFTGLRDSLPPQAKDDNLVDPSDEIALYLKATADNHVFIRNAETAALAASCRTPADILNLALSFEKDSIVFYASVREAVSEGQGKPEVEQLIREELSHVAFLTRELQKVKAAR